MTAYAAYARSGFPECPHCHLPTMPASDPVFDDERQHIVVGDERLRMGPLRWALLTLLRRRPGFVFGYAALIEHLWGQRGGSTKDLHATVHRLRGRLRGSKWRISTVSGVGYALVKREEK